MKSTPSLDYVSPLPPVRSGIADYSFDLLPVLDAICDLRVVCLPGQPPPVGLDPTIRTTTLENLGENGRVPLYQIGNNRHHIEIWRRALEQPGIVTLHDLNLHHLVIETTFGDENFDAYREALQRDHGWLGDTTARARRWHELDQPAMFSIGANRTLLRRQRGVLVHSQWARETLGSEDPDLAVRVIPMGVPLSELPDPEAVATFRAAAGVAVGAPLLGTFGFQTPIKRTDRAIAALSRPQLADAHLLVGGEVSTGLDLDRLAHDLGVAERVHFLGFLDFDDLQSAISACDLCLNLRYPTAGETSASLLRMLALGRPVLVSDYAQFTDLPDAVAVRVPLGDLETESEALAAAAGELLADRNRLQGMSEAARELVRTEHAPERAAAAIADACTELAALDPPGDAPGRPFVPTSLLWRKLAGELTVEGAEAEWTPGGSRTLRLRLENRSLARWLAAHHETGGVMIDVHWRATPTASPVQQTWLPLPHDLDPGETIEMQVTVRRPIREGTQLVIEPHLRDITGFNRIGGPNLVLQPA